MIKNHGYQSIMATNPIDFKKATLNYGKEAIEGVLVIANDPAITKLDKKSSVKIPKKIFVPVKESVFYTNSPAHMNEVLERCKQSDMLELLSYLDLSVPFIDDYFFDGDSGFIVNFYQPDQGDCLADQRYHKCPVCIQLLDPIEWLNNWDMSDDDKNKWIVAMINQNLPENIKNKLLLIGL